MTAPKLLTSLPPARPQTVPPSLTQCPLCDVWHQGKGLCSMCLEIRSRRSNLLPEPRCQGADIAPAVAGITLSVLVAPAVAGFTLSVLVAVAILVFSFAMSTCQ